MPTGSLEQAIGPRRPTAEEQKSQGEAGNLLARASSAYLRSARSQPVDWMEWGPAAFTRAAAEDKPILLDIGAVWCHWCHVMDRESYEHEATARIVNEYFIAVKVDRDERPDVDTRYQAAVSSISGQGGWPLTAFLTPTGKPYFGGTYFPPEDRHGRPSFQRVLLTMADAFLNRRDEVEESAASVMDAIEQNESFAGHSATPGPELRDKMVMSVLKAVDARHGGFGSQPKFPHSGAIDLLIDVAGRPGPETAVILPGFLPATLPVAARRAATLTLDKMSKGGIYDHLAGGFHRYSVDEHWVVPHFEKMAYDNSELLKNYVHAWQSFRDPESARMAREIIQWMDEWLTDRELGGFYASQDADFSLEDDGDYFTWTTDELAEILTPEELAIAGAYFDVGEIGDMHHNVAKNVLHVKHSIESVARKAWITTEEARALLRLARKKMYAARLKRPAPYVDKTVYVAWNGMCISAYLEAGRVLENGEAREFALKSLDRMLECGWDEKAGVAHVVAYGEIGGRAGRVAGVLDDYVFLALAALDAWEATGRMRYYDAASALTEELLQRFYDGTSQGFFDTEPAGAGESRLGALSARRKPLQDSPTPAGNPSAVTLLLRMHALNGKAVYRERAQATLESFGGVVEHLGLYACAYALAVQRSVHAPVQVCIVGEDALALELEAVALRGFAVEKTVVRFRRTQLGKLPPALLPPVLQETLPYLPPLSSSYAVVCVGNACQAPVKTAAELTALLAPGS